MQDYKPTSEEIEQLNKQIAFRYIVRWMCGRMDDLREQAMFARDMEELTGMKEAYKVYQGILSMLNLKYKDNVDEPKYPIGF